MVSVDRPSRDTIPLINAVLNYCYIFNYFVHEGVSGLADFQDFSLAITALEISKR
jgi:hypothetical protein